MIRYPDKINSKDKEFTLAHSLRGIRVHHCLLQVNTFNDLTSPPSFLQKIPPHPNSTAAGVQTFKTLTFRGLPDSGCSPWFLLLRVYSLTSICEGQAPSAFPYPPGQLCFQSLSFWQLPSLSKALLHSMISVSTRNLGTNTHWAHDISCWAIILWRWKRLLGSDYRCLWGASEHHNDLCGL